ncbi:MAG TPA: hypothetical protein VGV17_03125 [Bosea sp. (in: a-proteobacteria)]|uniref:S24 family peptidase n=1 Tax=Bosea sp. (in: a-proteobacteria) TaxID=1871050 RepID=UPI002DDD26C8|nr:hypothetical protein [Bosea sp. (in: a-proteobacteria)]HEV2552738.1 hypothetical protein [Bosea sp. (in: a-proteobacteria)]
MEPHDRLKAARKAANYATAAEAAAAMGVAYSTYSAHENGEKGLSRAGARYARFFHVSKAWLLDGTGDMRGDVRSIPIMGSVGAGATVQQIGDTAGHDAVGEVELPDAAGLGALIVRGESQWPKWIDGDVIIYGREPRRPGDEVNRYCIVETVEGERMIKMLRRSPKPGLWILESHNAPPQEVELQSAYRYVMTMAR